MVDVSNGILISVGASAWSEEPPNTPFTAWFMNNFGNGWDVWPLGLPSDINERVRQQEECVTAANSRPGINPLCKPLTALDSNARQWLNNVQPTGSGVIKLSIRQVPWHRQGGAQHVDVNKGKLWMVRLISGDFHAPDVMRSDLLRTPCTSNVIFGMFGNVADARRVIVDVINTLGDMLDSLKPLIAHRTTRDSARDTVTKIKYHRGLLLTMALESESPDVGVRKSTCLNFAKPGSGLRMLDSPAAVVATGCPCTRLEKFPTWLHYECEGSGGFLVTPNTKFGAETELIPTVMHSMKCELLSTIRTNPVSQKNVIRGVISETDADVLRVAADARVFATSRGLQEDSTTPEKVDWTATDKHKIIWLVPTLFVRSLTRALQPDLDKGKGKAKGKGKQKNWKYAPAESPAPASTKSSGKGKKGLGQQDDEAETDLIALFTALVNESETVPALHKLWETGSLHITTSAPKSQVGRWKLRFEPPLPGPHFGDVICIIMDWVGTYIFYHECLSKPATAAFHAGACPHVRAARSCSDHELVAGSPLGARLCTV